MGMENWNENFVNTAPANVRSYAFSVYTEDNSNEDFVYVLGSKDDALNTSANADGIFAITSKEIIDEADYYFNTSDQPYTDPRNVGFWFQERFTYTFNPKNIGYNTVPALNKGFKIDFLNRINSSSPSNQHYNNTLVKSDINEPLTVTENGITEIIHWGNPQPNTSLSTSQNFKENSNEYRTWFLRGGYSVPRYLQYYYQKDFDSGYGFVQKYNAVINYTVNSTTVYSHTTTLKINDVDITSTLVGINPLIADHCQDLLNLINNNQTLIDYDITATRTNTTIYITAADVRKLTEGKLIVKWVSVLSGIGEGSIERGSDSETYGMKDVDESKFLGGHDYINNVNYKREWNVLKQGNIYTDRTGNDYLYITDIDEQQNHSLIIIKNKW